MSESFNHFLKAAGQNVTRPRLAVFEFLQDHDPATVQAVIDRLTPAVDRASVYRTLSLFRELGVIHDIVAGGRRMIELTDSFDRHHHHLTCVRCGRHETIADEAIEQQLVAIARARGFEPTGHQVQISGVCQACQRVTQHHTAQ